MTISERKAYLEQYRGLTACPADFEAHWRSAWENAPPVIQERKTVPFANPNAVYEELTLSAPHSSAITARYIRPAGAGPFPTVLMFHDLVRPIRGWHHMTRFIAMGYSVLALQNRRVCPDWKELTAQEMEGQLLDALTLARTALMLPHTDPERILAWGEGFGGSLAVAASALVPQGAHCAILNPCPADVRAAVADGAWDMVDCVNFAPLLRKPLLLGTGLMDTLALPEGQYALYNRADCPKTHKVYAKYLHERVNSFENEVIKFFHI